MSTIRPPSLSIASHCSSYAATTSSSFTPAEGSLMRVVSFSGAFIPRLRLQPGNVDPAPRAPRFQGAVDQLQPLCALQQVPFERRVFANVADEKLPFGLERVVAGF